MNHMKLMHTFLISVKLNLQKGSSTLNKNSFQYNSRKLGFITIIFRREEKKIYEESENNKQAFTLFYWPSIMNNNY